MLILPPPPQDSGTARVCRPTAVARCNPIKDVLGCVISFVVGLAPIALAMSGTAYTILVLPSFAALFGGLAVAWLVRPSLLWLPAIGIGLSAFLLLTFGAFVFFLGYGTQAESGLPWHPRDLFMVWLNGLGLPVLLVTGFLTGVAIKLSRGGYFAVSKRRARTRSSTRV